MTVFQELSLARDLGSIMGVVRSAARQLTGADGATFVLRDRDRCYYADEDAIEPLWKGQRFPMSACISGWTMTHHEPVAIPDIYVDPRVPIDAYRPTFVKSVVMVPIRTAQPVGAIGTYWASEHHAAPEEIDLLATLANATAIAMENVQLYEELEQRVRERTAELERMQRQKDELAALIVHDLRSPANGIMLASRVRMRDKDSSERERKQWQNVFSSAEAIHRMAMNLLDVTRSEEGTFKPALADMGLSQLIADVAEQMTPLAAAQSIALAVDTAGAPERIKGDQDLLRRVFQNLVDNALRYSPEDGTVTIRARTVDADVEIRVIDEGMGIPEDAREAVFQKWTRLHQKSDRSSSGRGLGLTFCRLAVEGHGGTITIESHAPRGTEFVVRLPSPVA